MTASESERRIYVLVHGAWHGGWCWRQVAGRLRDLGHEVWTPTLTGLAERAHHLTPDTGLDTHIADVTRLIEFEDLRNVFLVGHSYAGMVISGVASQIPRRIGKLVYLDAFVPKAGESLLDILPPERAGFYLESAATAGDGWRVPPPPLAALGVTEPTLAAQVAPRLTDHPLRSFEQHAAAPVSETMPRVFVHCSEGPLAPSFARFAYMAQASAGWTSFELATGHDAMLTAAEALADLLN